MEQGLGIVDDMTELRTMARKCRRLADAISDGPTRDNLQSLAEEYELRAQRQRESTEGRPLMRWCGAGPTTGAARAGPEITNDMPR